MAAVTLDTPLAEQLSSAVHTRIVEEGWTQDDDSALAEYIVLMLANGKTQDQVASELAGELLQDAQGTEEFSRWLFQQVTNLSGGDKVESVVATDSAAIPASADVKDEEADKADSSIPAAYDTDMGDNAPDNAYVDGRPQVNDADNVCSPKGPRGSQSGRGGRGGRGGISKPGGDSALHRVRGNDRINSHMRGAPRGPRTLGNKEVRPGMQKALNVMAGANLGQPNPMMQNGQQNPFTPEQQMQYMQMMEQQANLMAQWNQLQQGMGGNPQQFDPRSLENRVQFPGRGRGNTRGRGRGAHQNGASRNPTTGTDAEVKSEAEPQGDGAMSVDGEQAQGMQQMQQMAQMSQMPQMPFPQGNGYKSFDPATTMCKFNTMCNNKECHFAHQAPMAPMNTPVDMALPPCSFGAACKNAACRARHPSPAKIRSLQAEQECKFWPNCSKPNCPFSHPSAPLCSFGASCRNTNCAFTHLKTPCKHNPCMNAKCSYSHAEGQIRKMADFSWTAADAKEKEEKKNQEHVSNRQFVDQTAGEEELIKPEAGNDTNGEAEAVPVAAEVKEEELIS